MNIRRFILRVVVGLLAFLLGVAVSWAIGGLNPFQSSSGSYRKHCGHSRSWSSTSESSDHSMTDGMSFSYEGRSCKKKRMFVAIPPPPPPPPVAPDPPGGS